MPLQAPPRPFDWRIDPIPPSIPPLPDEASDLMTPGSTSLDMTASAAPDLQPSLDTGPGASQVPPPLEGPEVPIESIVPVIPPPPRDAGAGGFQPFEPPTLTGAQGLTERGTIPSFSLAPTPAPVAQEPPTGFEPPVMPAPLPEATPWGNFAAGASAIERAYTGGEQRFQEQQVANALLLARKVGEISPQFTRDVLAPAVTRATAGAEGASAGMQTASEVVQDVAAGLPTLAIQSAWHGDPLQVLNAMQRAGVTGHDNAWEALRKVGRYSYQNESIPFLTGLLEQVPYFVSPGAFLKLARGAAIAKMTVGEYAASLSPSGIETILGKDATNPAIRSRFEFGLHGGPEVTGRAGMTAEQAAAGAIAAGVARNDVSRAPGYEPVRPPTDFSNVDMQPVDMTTPAGSVATPADFSTPAGAVATPADFTLPPGSQPVAPDMTPMEFGTGNRTPQNYQLGITMPLEQGAVGAAADWVGAALDHLARDERGAFGVTDANARQQATGDAINRIVGNEPPTVQGNMLGLNRVVTPGDRGVQGDIGIGAGERPLPTAGTPLTLEQELAVNQGRLPADTGQSALVTTDSLEAELNRIFDSVDTETDPTVIDQHLRRADEIQSEIERRSSEPHAPDPYSYENLSPADQLQYEASNKHAEADALDEYVRDSKVNHLLDLVAKSGDFAGQLPETVSVQQFRKYLNREPHPTREDKLMAGHAARQGRTTRSFGRIPIENMTDQLATELGFEDGQALQQEIQNVYDARQRASQLRAQADRTTAEAETAAQSGGTGAGEAKGVSGELSGSEVPPPRSSAASSSSNGGDSGNIIPPGQRGPERQIGPSGLTPEGEELLAKVDAGGVPAYVTANLKRIARDHGITPAEMKAKTPNEIIDAIREKRVEPPAAGAGAGALPPEAAAGGSGGVEPPAPGSLPGVPEPPPAAPRGDSPMPEGGFPRMFGEHNLAEHNRTLYDMLNDTASWTYAERRNTMEMAAKGDADAARDPQKVFSAVMDAPPNAKGDYPLIDDATFAAGYSLMKNLVTSNRIAEASQLGKRLAERRTEVGRALQAGRIVDLSSPEGIIMYANDLFKTALEKRGGSAAAGRAGRETAGVMRDAVDEATNAVKDLPDLTNPAAGAGLDKLAAALNKAADTGVDTSPAMARAARKVQTDKTIADIQELVKTRKPVGARDALAVMREFLSDESGALRFGRGTDVPMDPDAMADFLKRGQEIHAMPSGPERGALKARLLRDMEDHAAGQRARVSEAAKAVRPQRKPTRVERVADESGADEAIAADEEAVSGQRKRDLQYLIDDSVRDVKAQLTDAERQAIREAKSVLKQSGAEMTEEVANDFLDRAAALKDLTGRDRVQGVMDLVGEVNALPEVKAGLAKGGRQASEAALLAQQAADLEKMVDVNVRTVYPQLNSVDRLAVAQVQALLRKTGVELPEQMAKDFLVEARKLRALPEAEQAVAKKALVEKLQQYGPIQKELSRTAAIRDATARERQQARIDAKTIDKLMTASLAKSMKVATVAPASRKAVGEALRILRKYGADLPADMAEQFLNDAKALDRLPAAAQDEARMKLVDRVRAFEPVAEKMAQETAAAAAAKAARQAARAAKLTAQKTATFTKNEAVRSGKEAGRVQAAGDKPQFSRFSDLAQQARDLKQEMEQLKRNPVGSPEDIRAAMAELNKKAKDLTYMVDATSRISKKAAAEYEQEAVTRIKRSIGPTGAELPEALARSWVDRMKAIQAMPQGTVAEKGARYWKQQDLLADVGRMLPPSSFDHVLDTLNLPRALMTTWDMSFMLRQGFKLGVGHPEEWAKTFAAQIRAFRSKEMANEVETHILFGPLAKARAEAGVEFVDRSGALRQREEAYMTRLAEKVPWVAPSERAYTVAGNKLRADVWDKVVTGWLPEAERQRSFETLEDLIKATGKTEDDFKKLAKYVNYATGRGDLGIAKQIAPLLNAVFFAPKYFLSGPEGAWLFAKTMASRTAAPELKAMMAKDFAAYLAVNLSVLAALKASGVADVEIDPRSTQFGKIRIGNTTINFWGPELTLVRYIVQAAQGRKTSSGRTTDPIPQQAGENFIRSKLSPWLGEVFTQLAGNDMAGEQVTGAGDRAKNLLLNFVPLGVGDVLNALLASSPVIGGADGGPAYPKTAEEAARQVWDSLASSDPKMGLLAGAASFFGGSVTSYTGAPHAQSVVTQELFPGRKYSSLNSGERAAVNRDERVENAQEEYTTNAGTPQQQMTHSMELLHKRNTAAEQKLARLLSPVSDAGQPKEPVSGADLRKAIQGLKMERYQAAKTVIDSVAQQQLTRKDVPAEDAFAQAYWSADAPVDETTGRPDFEQQKVTRAKVLADAKAAGVNPDYITGTNGYPTPYRVQRFTDPKVKAEVIAYDHAIKYLSDHYWNLEDQVAQKMGPDAVRVLKLYRIASSSQRDAINAKIASDEDSTLTAEHKKMADIRKATTTAKLEAIAADPAIKDDLKAYGYRYPQPKQERPTRASAFAAATR